jgi:hypothetical protein
MYKIIEQEKNNINIKHFFIQLNKMFKDRPRKH